MVGCLMVASVARLKLSDLSETIPVFSAIVLMSFTYNVGIGMTAGFILYPLFMVLTGRARAVKSGMWVLAGLSARFFVFYPY
jgi:AGZA family xanthine/uracil permease-like MFS transporter